jgi:hypothetical protein
MNADVPYLARLTRQAAGQPMLRPPRQLFTGDVDMPVHSTGHPGTPRRRAVNAAMPSPPGSLPPSDHGGQSPLPEATAPPPAEGTERARETSRQDGSATVEPEAAVLSSTASARSTWPEPEVALGSPDISWPPPAAPHRPGAAHPEVPGVAAVGAANPDGTHPGTPLTGPLPPRSPWPTVDAGHERPPGSRVSSLWEGPVELPAAVELAPAAGRPDRRAGPLSPGAPVALPVAPPSAPSSWPGPIAPAGSRQDHRADDAGAAAVARRAEVGPGALGPGGTTDLDRSREPAAIRDLTPQPISNSPPVAMPRTEPGEPLVPPRPRVSIGTIEVTVVPPAPPAPAVREIQPPAPVTRGWSRSPSAFAASAGADRLRYGFRRWYGTAQG